MLTIRKLLPEPQQRKNPSLGKRVPGRGLLRLEHLRVFTWQLCGVCELMGGDTAPLWSPDWIRAADR